MIKLDNFEIVGWEHALRGMRNPMNSWDKGDSYPAVDCKKCGVLDREGICIPKDHPECDDFKCLAIGPNDHKLMMQLRNAGTDHRKFMRMIDVYVDITAPLYWWKEFDTYKVGTVANSCSTMHKIHEKEFTMDDFSHEHLIPVNSDGTIDKDLIMSVKGSDATSPCGFMEQIVWYLNYWRKKFIETKDKKYWWQMIQLLPTSYNQKRTVLLNYEVLANIYKSRKSHKLDEWVEFCKWIESLPYSEVITGPALSDIPISDEIMEEAKRRVEAQYAKEYEAFCESVGVDASRGLTAKQFKVLGVDLAYESTINGECDESK